LATVRAGSRSKADPAVGDYNSSTVPPQQVPRVRWLEAQIAALTSVASILTEADDVEEGTRQVLAAVGQHLGFTVGVAWVRQGEGLRRESQWHTSAVSGETADPAALRRGEELAGRVWLSAEPECVELPPVEPGGTAAALAAAFAFPLFRGKDVKAVLAYGSTAAHPLDPPLKACLEAIGQQFSQFVARIHAEEALTAATAEHHIMFDNANDAFGVSVDERFVYVNQAFATMFGYDHPDEVVGVSIYENVPPVQREVVREHRDRRLAGLPEPMRYHSRGRRQDGIEFLSEVRATDYWINGRMYTLAILRDITAERNAQDALNASVTALRRANADLEQFAYAASHDLQEPLRVIALYSELLRRRHECALNEDGREILATITDAARRINELVKDLLSYTHTASLDATVPSAVNTNDVMNEVRSSLRVQIASTHATVTSDLLPAVRVHRTHLVQLFQNLISNALKYQTPGQSPAIHVSGTCRDGFVELVFRDNGIGIPPEYHQRIFGVFKRLHSQRVPGTGIGLAICKKIVEYYGGTIRVESMPGDGATFILKLPATEKTQ
jgi:PAS domain S-box-containing protein